MSEIQNKHVVRAMNRKQLDIALHAQGDVFLSAMTLQHAHLYAGVTLDISADHQSQMQSVIAAVEEVVAKQALGEASSLGVFYGYDFHLNIDGAHLIEINTNAGGAFLNTLLHDQAAMEAEFLTMFRNEWALARGDAEMRCVAIVDEQPQTQYLYPEFILAQQMFARAGYRAYIAAPEDFQPRSDGLYLGEEKVDLIYNRLTDFSLQTHPHLLTASAQQQVLITPSPEHYLRYADKRKLALLSDANALQDLGVSADNITVLKRGVPQTQLIATQEAVTWWGERKQWFFKPVSGYGSKGAYRGDKVTKRVFEEIMQSDYVAQRLAVPGEVEVQDDEGQPQKLKFDVRCYVYAGKIQLIAARLYQGQTTNFRTPGGGFARVSVQG